MHNDSDITGTLNLTMRALDRVLRDAGESRIAAALPWRQLWAGESAPGPEQEDRKSTRLNSSHYS